MSYLMRLLKTFPEVVINNIIWCCYYTDTKTTCTYLIKLAWKSMVPQRNSISNVYIRPYLADITRSHMFYF